MTRVIKLVDESGDVDGVSAGKGIGGAIGTLRHLILQKRDQLINVHRFVRGGVVNVRLVLGPVGCVSTIPVWRVHAEFDPFVVEMTYFGVVRVRASSSKRCFHVPGSILDEIFQHFTFKREDV